MRAEKPSLAKSNGFLEPLPSFNLVESVEKLDAGLRSLDHCKNATLSSSMMITAEMVSRSD